MKVIRVERRSRFLKIDNKEFRKSKKKWEDKSEISEKSEKLRVKVMYRLKLNSEQQ